MKNKWDHEAVNSQEDEDGFSLNPDSVFNYESTGGKQGINSNENTADTEFGSSKLTVASIEARQRISQRLIPLRQSASTITTGTWVTKRSIETKYVRRSAIM